MPSDRRHSCVTGRSVGGAILVAPPEARSAGTGLSGAATDVTPSAPFVDRCACAPLVRVFGRVRSVVAICRLPPLSWLIQYQHDPDLCRPGQRARVSAGAG